MYENQGRNYLMLRDIVIDSRSCRSFDESVKLGENDLRDLIDTARLCPSAVNRQPLKYRLVFEHDEVEDVVANTSWAGLLRDRKFPPEGHHPSAFIVICCDTKICENPDSCKVDVGIAAQTIMLLAAEQGLGGCMIGAFNPTTIAEKLRLPKKCHPVLILALGAPDEMILICNMKEDGNTDYFRDTANIHFVPKRSLDDVIIE